MRNSGSVFRFKQFECFHCNSSMKIGVDAVLLGSWASVHGDRILDVGTGCGIIALICAQRNNNALIKAIDIDIPSIGEADVNFKNSKWSSRLEVSLTDFSEYTPPFKYDLIISNPPYFSSGINHPSGARMIARHEGSLSPAALIKHGSEILARDGRIAMIIPFERADEIIKFGILQNLVLSRRTDVYGRAELSPSRSLLEFVTDQSLCPIQDTKKDILILEQALGVPTDQYRELCKEFYLYF